MEFDIFPFIGFCIGQPVFIARLVLVLLNFIKRTHFQGGIFFYFDEQLFFLYIGLMAGYFVSAFTFLRFVFSSTHYIFSLRMQKSMEKRGFL